VWSDVVYVSHSYEVNLLAWMFYIYHGIVVIVPSFGVTFRTEVKKSKCYKNCEEFVQWNIWMS
jgi:hypothetical protein